MEEARLIQDKLVREAKSQGYTGLVFKKNPGVMGLYPECTAQYGGQTYKTFSTTTIEEGVTYLCKTEDFLGRMYATPVTRLFDFPKPTPIVKPVQEKKSPTVPVATKPAGVETSSIDALAKMWGARQR